MLFVGVFTFNGKYFLYTNLNLAPGKAIHRYDEQRWWWYSGFFFKMHIMRKKILGKTFSHLLMRIGISRSSSALVHTVLQIISKKSNNTYTSPKNFHYLFRKKLKGMSHTLCALGVYFLTKFQ